MRPPILPFLALALVMITANACSQGGASTSKAKPHLKKTIYEDVAAWPATGPGDVSLPHFQPFRAVYDRNYKQGSGAAAGAQRRDRVIVHAEHVAWDGRPALAITLLDSGSAAHADTAARSLVQIVDRETLAILFEMGPIPGKAKDYYLARTEDHAIRLNLVATDTQKYQSKTLKITQPGFGPGTWVMAAMKLAPEAKIHLAPYHSQLATSVLSASDHARVLRREMFVDGGGLEHSAWVLETGGYFSPASPKVQHLYLTDRPPYYLGTENMNLDTGERTRYVWLRSFQPLAD